MKRNRLMTCLVYLALILISFLMVYPFLWMLFGSFKTNQEIIQYPLSLLPRRWVLTGWQGILTLSGNPLGHYFKNSIIISGGSTLLVVLATSLGGYALYRKGNLPGFSLIQTSFSVSMMYPAVLLLIPLYIVVVQLKLYGTNNFLGIILASSTGAWGAALPFFLFKNFFQSLPYDLIESATIDGATEFQIFFRIVTPVMYPVFTTATLISFLSSWGLWLPVLMLSKDMSTYNLAAMLVNLNSDLGVDLSMTAALSTAISLPVVIIFLITQRKVMEGIAAGSVKG